SGFAGLAYVLPTGGFRVVVDACGPLGAQDQTGDVVPLCGQFVSRLGDPCVSLGGKRQESGSRVGFVACESRSVNADERTDFVNDCLEDLFGGHAPGEERGDAPERSLLGLALSVMRVSSGTV